MEDPTFQEQLTSMEDRLNGLLGESEEEVGMVK